ncbi:short transient receptor potential channel 4-like [Amphiura filiformis]|uniref:short transient receptor potential channel 4-like n=1 Tax=Amphiura filiformis TaxID=82378 RepID=UPI003B221558
MGKKKKRNRAEENEPGKSPDPFLGVVENNDMETAQFMMKSRKSLARRLSCMRDAFAQAIHDNHLEMLQLLLEGNLTMGGALFHAIDQNSVTAVEMICKKLQSSKLAMKTALNAFADDDEFPRYTTPLLFASCHNQRDIVQILMEFGAEFPSVDAMISRAGEPHYDCALARLHYYQAISSEAYLLATEDPMESAFHAGKLIRAFEIGQVTSFSKQYRHIQENLDIFLSKLLTKVDGTKEIKLLLCHGGFNKSRRQQKRTIKISEEPNSYLESELASTLPRRIQDAIKLNYKQFLVNPNCQQYILSRWYRGRTSWLNLSRKAFAIWTILVIIFKPILCLLYILVPMKWVQGNLKAPYVRFLLHVTSRAWFVFLLLESTLSAIIRDHEIEKNYEGLPQIAKYIQYAAGPPGYLTIAIYIMIIGK